MNPSSNLSRRMFLAATASSTFAAAGARGDAVALADSDSANRQQIPLKIGHRADNMKMIGRFDVFEVARKIPGLMGVELQVAGGTPDLRDLDAVRRYKKEANRWGMVIPSVAGVWGRGESIRSPSAGVALLQAVRAAELLGASVILVAFFSQNVPNMNDESSYGPTVGLLQQAAPYAADAGVTLGLENSLSPADNLKLVDLIDRPSVKLYYDAYRTAASGHSATAISGIALLGKQRICQVHVQSDKSLIAERALIDWPEVFRALNGIAYGGWYVFETQHTSQLEMIRATTKNIEFMKRYCRMPLA